MTSASPEPPQPESPPEGQFKLPFLIGALGIIILLLILAIFLMVRSAAPPAMLATSTLPLLPSLSPSPPMTATATFTLTPSPRPSFTPRPSATPTVSPTVTPTPPPTLPPSLTPAVPVEENDPYVLAFWSPEMADQAIGLLEAYPETLSSYARGPDDSGYYAAFQYAIFALREALLQFPTAPQAERWLWHLAYNYARSGDPQAGSLYTELITQELNDGTVQLPNLYEWGLDLDPPAIIDLFPLDIPPGYLSSSLVKVSLEENGSSYFWLLEDPTGFTAYPLATDFDFAHPVAVNHFIEDILGEGSQVVGIYRTSGSESGTYALPHLFSLVQEPPIELPFEPASPPAVGPDFQNIWQPVPAGPTAGDLEFSATVFPACPVTVKHLYEWNGSSFSFLEASYEITPAPDLLGYCEQVINHAERTWGLETTVQLMETLLPIWPPATTVDGDPYPEDALDAWRYRLAIYHALLANQDEARGYAESIVSEPASAESRWIAPAEAFLDAYQEQGDIYRVCLQASFCDPRLGLQSLVSSFEPAQYPDLPQLLPEAGVTVFSRGYFDFDNDGVRETWLVVRHQPGGQLEFWILYPSEEQTYALFVTPLEADEPRVTQVEPVSEPPLILIDPDITFQLLRSGPDQQPFIKMVQPETEFSSDRTAAELQRIEDSLLSGGDPADAEAQLVDLAGQPFFTCSYLLCPHYYYMLGLAHELTNNDQNAVDTYLTLWREFLESPYTTLARLKLAGPSVPPGPSPTPTRTITPRPTKTSTRIPTLTRTPTITGTPPTATLTQSGTPATATLTQSGTPATATLAQTQPQPYPTP